MRDNGNIAHSLQQAINEKCKDCVAGQVEELNGCPVEDCPLYRYRPYCKERKPKPPGLRRIGRKVKKRKVKRKNRRMEKLIERDGTREKTMKGS